MAIRVETPTSADALAEFLVFYDQVYAPRSARWPAFVPFQLPTLTGHGPFARDRRLQPFVARDGDRLVARALAVVDARYQRHWGERLGHVSLFEALPDSGPATRALLDAVCEWLASEGADAARAGFGLLDFPFPIDAYEALPPSWLRQSPAYYHTLLKDAGFETEQGWVDYKIAATPALVERWERMVAAMRPAGITLVPLAGLPAATRMAQLATVWNESFARHWGFVPFTETELETIFELFAVSGMLESSLIAFEGQEAVGALWYGPDASAFATCAPGRTLAPDERLNTLGIAVRAPARGRGVNLAMAAHAFLGSVRQGATHVSYTLVLDDNWPSRRTAEKLGASVCASYVTYRRNFREALSMELREVGRDVYACLQEDRGLGTSNSGFVDRGGGMVVDTFWDLPHTRELIATYARVRRGPARRVVNTHHNGDHCWGNQLFPEAEIIGHRRCAAAFGQERPEVMQMLRTAAGSDDPALAALGRQLAAWDFRGIELRPPTTIFDDRLELDLDGVAVHLVYVGPAHTAGDVIVHLPAARVVFTGDVLFRLCTPIGWEGTYDRWLAALDTIVALDPAVVVPGHGPLCGVEGPRDMKAYLTYVRAEANRFFDAGLPVVEAAGRIDLGPYAGWTEPERIVFQVERAYRERRGVPWDEPLDATALFRGMADLRRSRQVTA